MVQISEWEKEITNHVWGGDIIIIQQNAINVRRRSKLAEPKFLIDFENNKFYLMLQSFHKLAWHVVIDTNPFEILFWNYTFSKYNFLFLREMMSTIFSQHFYNKS